MRKLPPLNSLKAFESAARHQSFSQAAEELGVTQSAISKQIRLLEDYCDKPLFTRKHQQVLVIEEAKHYLDAITQALDAMEQATDQLIQPHQKETLHFNVLPSLTTRWLMPLLEIFTERYPMITTHIDNGDGPIDFAKNGADIAIRVAKRPVWPGCHSTLMFQEELLPVCTPKLQVKCPDDLAHHTLLQHTSRPTMWPDYLEAIGYGNVPIHHGAGFEHFFMLIQAALDGMGVVLIPKFLIEKELQEEKLIIPFKTEFESPFNYYLVAPKQKAALKKVQRFEQWLLEKESS